jgi:hypothetical protein
VFCGDGALLVETCVSAKNSPPRCQQLDRFKTSSVVEALKTVKDWTGPKLLVQAAGLISQSHRRSLSDEPERI